MTSHRPSFIAIAFGALCIFLAGCSSTAADDPIAAAATSAPDSSSAETSSDAPEGGPPGVLYVTTSNGEMQAITPASGRTETIVSPGDDEPLVFEVAPADRSSRLHVLLSNPTSQIDTSLNELDASGLQALPFEEFTPLTICLDNHTNADVSVGHQLLLGTNGQNGSSYDQLAFDGPGALSAASIVELTRVSLVCPRYNGTRDVVATAAPVVDGDPSTVATFIDGARGSHQVVIEGCSLTPTSFSPDDEWLLLSAVCFDSQWSDSGLYALPLVNLGQEITLADMPNLGSGVFGRSAWHPDSNWVVSTRIDAIEGQSPGIDFQGERAALVLIDIRTGDVIVQPVVGGSQPHSLVWLAETVHGS